VHSAPIASLRRAFQPSLGPEVLKRIEEVTTASVKNAVRRVLAKDRRVVVVTVPAGQGSGSKVAAP
jgi:predicted Zn-dependent peptidase